MVLLHRHTEIASMAFEAEFGKGGVQDLCEDACSICLEYFCQDDPATLTCCKHEYHLQCILEWSQRSKECPICWQPLSLKDCVSQELLNDVDDQALCRNKIEATSTHHRSPVEYEFHQFASCDEDDFIMQHVAGAAIRRAQQMGQREHIECRPSPVSQGDHHVMGVSSTATGTLPASSFPVLSPQETTSSDSTATVITVPRCSTSSRGTCPSDSAILGEIGAREAPGNSSSDMLETFKSRIIAASSRYKDTLTNSTKGLRERCTRGGFMQDLGARACELSAGVVRALDRLSVQPSTGIQHVPRASPEHVSGSYNHSSFVVGSLTAGSRLNETSSFLSPSQGSDVQGST